MRHITTHYTPATGLRGLGDTSWQPHGACHGMDPWDADAVFFPGPRDHAAIAEAKELCGWCPVRRDCLNYALEHDLQDGIWGGLTEAERRPWHKGLPQRMDYSRVVAFFNGRDVHLTDAERQVVIDHAYVRGWRADRLAAALQISHKHARDLLRQVANKVFDRDLTLGVPPNPYKKKGKQNKKKRKQAADRPGTEPQEQQRPAKPRSAETTSERATLGKAA
ncbi:WhiB family transcriptional regulator [Streptomyces sp. ISL-12]|uniref:WhiB family transcriptional regulator n=1 Tax=Streptomyces sp. ISL-12 TaxID=2819177 RepID=UPI001BE7A901|nr:WhiB family transcriptional regulator [Streptomyces sp. ISL-12]MBT2416167.1 WhiB family transcriptional regulator [Streptomyces sp. ISL-12]